MGLSGWFQRTRQRRVSTAVSAPAAKVPGVQLTREQVFYALSKGLTVKCGSFHYCKESANTSDYRNFRPFANIHEAMASLEEACQGYWGRVQPHGFNYEWTF